MCQARFLPWWQPPSSTVTLLTWTSQLVPTYYSRVSELCLVVVVGVDFEGAEGFRLEGSG